MASLCTTRQCSYRRQSGEAPPNGAWFQLCRFDGTTYPSSNEVNASWEWGVLPLAPAIPAAGRRPSGVGSLLGIGMFQWGP